MCEDSTYLVSPTGSVNNSNPDETKGELLTLFLFFICQYSLYELEDFVCSVYA